MSAAKGSAKTAAGNSELSKKHVADVSNVDLADNNGDAGACYDAVSNKRKDKAKRNERIMPMGNSAPAAMYSEVLMYVGYHRDRSSSDALKRCVLTFFTPDEISDAKKQLVLGFSDELQECSAAGTDRRSSTARTVQDAELDDIMTIFGALDAKDLLNKRYVFAASHWDRIPKCSPEDTNMCLVADRQLQLESTVASLVAASVKADDTVTFDKTNTDMITALKQSVNDVNSKLTALSNDVTAQKINKSADSGLPPAGIFGSKSFDRVDACPIYISVATSCPGSIAQCHRVWAIGNAGQHGVA